MAQSISHVWLHLIFSTRNRDPFLKKDETSAAMHAYLAATCAELQCPVRLVGGASDHVHILSQLSRTMTISELIYSIKSSSSKWIKERGGMLKKFAWQNGYAAFSVSPSHLSAVERYIADQKNHHQKVSFKDELLRFFRRYGVEYDERYLWD